MTHVQTIPLSQLEPSGFNPRKSFDEKSISELAESIHTDGVLQNLVVIKDQKKHSVIVGGRRYRALKALEEAGKIKQDYQVPVEIKSGLSEAEILRIATVENMQRENMPPLEEAEALTTLIQSGEKLDNIVAKTGLSVKTVQRRLVLMDLSETVKEALSSEDITLAQAEALSLASHEKQNKLLPEVTDEYGWFSKPDDIRDSIIESLPSVAMALFDSKEYQGEFTRDLLAEDDQTYFNDVDQFMTLQRTAAEKLTEKHEKTAQWATFEEGHHINRCVYKDAKEGQKGGVVILLRPDGEVQVYENMIHAPADKETQNKLKKPRPTYSKPMLEYIGMHKSIAAQSVLLDHPRTIKEWAVAKKLSGFKAAHHDSLGYFLSRDANLPPALQKIEARAKEIVELFKSGKKGSALKNLANLFSSVEKAYDQVRSLSDDQLEHVFLTLQAMEFGQYVPFPHSKISIERLDTNKGSIFNKIATDLKVDMRNHWRPCEVFLSSRNKIQLQSIITKTESSLKFQSAAQHKKGDLVKAMSKHFAECRSAEKPNKAQQKMNDWIPEVMNFPAIDPDIKPKTKPKASKS